MINAFKPFMATISSSFSQAPAAHVHTVESLTRDVDIKPLHSHNDYWRQQPLFDALAHGCRSIESDIWKFKQNYQVTTAIATTTFYHDEAYVGHNQVFLRNNLTLNSLYLDPLFEFLQSTNPQISNIDPDVKHGVFFNSPETSLYLWMDIKLDANDTFEYLQPQLQRFIDQDYLSYYDSQSDTFVERPLTVILTGNLPSALVKAQPKVYTFLDAPLKDFKSMSNSQMVEVSKFSKVASASMTQLLGNEEFQTRPFSHEESVSLARFINIAHKYGMKTRIWGGVDWPKSLVYKHNMALIQMGCDLVNVNDLEFGSELVGI